MVTPYNLAQFLLCGFVMWVSPLRFWDTLLWNRIYSAVHTKNIHYIHNLPLATFARRL